MRDGVPRTDFEIWEECTRRGSKYTQDALRHGRKAFEEPGIIKDTGITRTTPNNCQSIVWVYDQEAADRAAKETWTIGDENFPPHRREPNPTKAEVLAAVDELQSLDALVHALSDQSKDIFARIRKMYEKKKG